MNATTETSISVRPIGMVHSPLVTPEGAPIQAALSAVSGTLEVFPAYADGLADLDGFDRILVVYRFHAAGTERLRVTPFLDDHERGVFATRSPVRPNRLGLSILHLKAIAGATLHVEGLDMIEGTPVLDIKPYVPAFDAHSDGRIGWFAGRLHATSRKVADDRMR